MDLSYLWGIETQFETVNKNSGDRIYLTYEELKQLSANPPASLVAGIYLTYEELKLIPRLQKQDKSERIYLTYEELKHEK